MYLVDWIRDHATVSELPKETISELYHRWKTEVLPAVNDNHRGECTHVPMTCRKCKIDEILDNATTIAYVIKGYNNENN